MLMATKTTKTKKTAKAETTKGKTTKTTKATNAKATKATKTAKAKATKTTKETKPKTTKTTKAKATTKATKAKTTKTTTTKTTKTTKATKPKTSKAAKTTKTKTTPTTKAKATTTKPKATKTTKTTPKTKTAPKTTKTAKTAKATKTTPKTTTTPKAKTTKPKTTKPSLKKHPIHIITFIDSVKSPSKCAQKTLPDLLDHLLDWSKHMDHGRSYYAYRKERSEKLHQNIDEFWAEIIKTLRLYEIYAWPLSGHPETGKPYRLGVLKTKDTDVIGLCYSPVHDHDGNVLPLDAIEVMIQEKIAQLNTK